MGYFVTDNPVSLRLGTHISLHTYNKIPSSVVGKTNRQNKQYRLGLTKMLLKKRRQNPNNRQTCQHLEQYFCFSGKSWSARVTKVLPIFSWTSEKCFFSWVALKWIYIVVWMSLKTCCFTYIYKGKFRLLGHQCQISFKEHEILELRIDRKSQCWSITNTQLSVMKEANIT